MIINLEYYLDRPYKPGVDQEEVKYAKKHNQPLDRFLIDKKRSIMAILNFGGKLIKVNVGIKILPKYFDITNNRLKRSAPGSFLNNNMLDKIKSDVLTAIMRARSDGKISTHDDVRAIAHQTMFGGLPKKTQKRLIDYYDEWTAERSLFLKPLTIKKYASLKNCLVNFEKHSGRRLHFDDINKEFDNDFRMMLLGKGLLNGTIQKYYAVLKVFMNWGKDKEYHNTSDFIKFKLEKTTSDVVYLTEGELDAMCNLDLTLKPGQEKVRDIFLFQCYTGQRFSDIKNLKYSDIKNTGDGFEWHLYQIKGNKDRKVVIPLTKIAEEIYLKIGSKDGYLFECNSDPVTNRMLKEIAKSAGILEPISQVKYSGIKRIETVKPKYEYVSTHTARRTYTTLSLQKGMRAELVMAITGHANYKTMQGYMKLVDAQIRKEMLEAWN